MDIEKISAFEAEQSQDVGVQIKMAQLQSNFYVPTYRMVKEVSEFQGLPGLMVDSVHNGK